MSQLPISVVSRNNPSAASLIAPLLALAHRPNRCDVLGFLRFAVSLNLIVPGWLLRARGCLPRHGEDWSLCTKANQYYHGCEPLGHVR